MTTEIITATAKCLIFMIVRMFCILIWLGDEPCLEDAFTSNYIAGFEDLTPRTLNESLSQVKNNVF